MSKNLPLTDINENFVGCLTSTCHSTCFSFFMTLPSTYSFSLESLIMTNASAKGENCILRPHNVSSNLPTVTTCFNASKISLSTSLPSLKLSLLFQNIGGGLDASGLMYIALVALKICSLTLYNSPSFTSFSSLSLFNYASLLLAFSLN